ncbi:MAG: T9SS type A sorting domain-containing protein [Prevotellaceae bacterium]|jgi:hypothetical protein|nr:T9SS type A sorting domain-containing protein [Prevotellaceae bacterium]
MKKINLLKTALLTAVLMLSCVNVWAEKYCVNIENLPEASRLNVLANFDGWNFERFYHELYSEEITLNGGSGTTRGTIISNNIDGECNSIHFSYYSTEGIRLRVSVQYPRPSTTRVVDTMIVIIPNAWIDVRLDELNVKGLYRILISNESNPDQSIVWDVFRITLKDICINNVADTEAPSVPSNLSATPAETEIALSWTASTDNVAVAGYTLYLNNDSINTVTETEYTFTNLTADTEYTLAVEARDAAGNKSAQASIIERTTTTTGIPEAASSVQFCVSPNPFTDFIEIETACGGEAAIYDLSGRTVLTVSLSAGSNRIDVAALSKGVYTLRQGVNAVKIVK